MKKILPLLAIYCMLFSPTQLRAEIWYIIPNGTGSGQANWGNASGNLQSVINLAQSGDEIWVAQGTYVPTIKAGNGPEARDVSFVLKSGVAIYGGFLGNEGARTERKPVINITTLSGDINNTPTDNADDAYHVVISVGNDNNTILDGFTIEKGNANGTTGNITVATIAVPRSSGGGIVSRSSEAKFTNLVIQKNLCFGGNGGAIYSSPGNLTIADTKILGNESNTSGSNGTSGAIWIAGAVGLPNTMILTNVTVKDNTAKGNGGAIYMQSYCELTLNNVTFEKNTTPALGGAIYSLGLSAAPNKIAFNQVTFKENSSTQAGGAINIGNYNDITFENVNFENNTSLNAGGAVFVAGNVSFVNRLAFDKVIFNGNSSTGAGGAVNIGSYSNVTFKDATFGNNTAANLGGAMYVSGNSATLNNLELDKVTFKSNAATSSGGAIYIGGNTNYIINNTSFVKNEANLSAGALFLLKGTGETTLASSLIRNTVFYGNKSQNATSNGGGAIAISSASPTVVNCTFYDNYSKLRGGAINVYSGATVAIYNSILFANTADDAGADIYNTIGAGTLTNIDLKNSLTQAAGTNAVNGNVVGANPSFFNLDENHPFFLQLNYTTSPAVNTGSNTHFANALTSKDRAGYDRIYGGTIDMGAYESNPIVLPVSLDKYEAKLQDGVVRLTWTTLSEQHNSYFIIEKSADGKTFEPLHKITAKGDGTGAQQYSVEDLKPYTPYTYYRLKQVDKDGTTKSYEILPVKIPTLTFAKANVYPNPVIANRLNVATANKPFTSAKIVNIYGQLVKEFTVDANSSHLSLDITGLSPNIYFLQLIGNNRKETVKFQKL